REHVGLSRAEAGWNVLDRLADPYKSIRRGARLEHVLIDEAFDVKLPKTEPHTPRVEAEEPDVLVGLALRILLLGRVCASVASLNEPGAQHSFALPLDAAL